MNRIRSIRRPVPWSLPLLLLLLSVMLACSTAKPPASRPSSSIPPGSYRTDTLPAADAAGRIMTLELDRDSAATLTAEFIGRGSVAQHGNYLTDGLNLTVTFPARGAQGAETFRWRLVSHRLVPVDWDRNIYGPAGLTLHQR